MSKAKTASWKAPTADSADKPQHRIFLALLAIVIAVTALGFASAKYGLWLDEVYSYGLSNGHYTPFLKQVAGGSLVDAMFTPQDFDDYLAVQAGEQFDFGSVLYNQEADVHPPLFYLLLNAVSSLVPDTFSKWIGLTLNLALFAVSAVLLWFLTRRITASKNLALAAVALWALSQAGISTMLMIRMYMLLTCLTLALGCLIARISAGDAKGWEFPIVGLVVFAGLFTQYLYAIYAFFACLACGILLLRKRRWQHAALLAVFSIAGVALFILAWPTVLTQHSGSGAVSGTAIASNLLSVSTWVKQIFEYGRLTIKGMPVSAFALAISLLALAAAFAGQRIKARAANGKIKPAAKHNSLVPVIVLPAVATWLITAIIAPYVSLRYAYNVMPFVALAATCAFGAMRAHIRPRQACVIERSRTPIVAISACTVLTLIATLIVQPEYLNTEYTEYDAAIAPYTSSPCVYFNDNYSTTMTQDILQLRQFNDVFSSEANDVPSAALLSYLDSRRGTGAIVVYVDTAVSGYDAQTVVTQLSQQLGASSFCQLYPGAWLVEGSGL